jgi:hypothetical protein
MLFCKGLHLLVADVASRLVKDYKGGQSSA